MVISLLISYVRFNVWPVDSTTVLDQLTQISGNHPQEQRNGQQVHKTRDADKNEGSHGPMLTVPIHGAVESRDHTTVLRQRWKNEMLV